MSDSGSSSRRTPPLPSPVSRTPTGSGSAVSSPSPAAGAHGSEATVITSRSPLTGEPVTISESAYRILQGQILAGDHLCHFELVQFIGGGGMGRVYRAIDSRLARTVALKILPPDQAADPETLRRFQNEAQSTARLDHENIARVYYVGEDLGLNFIVFEFVEGVNLRDLVETRGPLPLAEAVSYTFQVANALAHAAARNVVHRDIKPSNLLITPEGQVKLIDMGLARLREADNPAQDLTASGVTLGTFDYISPEQARDPRNADVRSDIYSLGCTFFFMLTGRPPFPEGTVLQKLLQHQGDQPPDVHEFRPELPHDVTGVLGKMLAKDPRQRYRNPDELVGDLLALAEQVGLEPLGPGGHVWIARQPPPPPLLKRHLPWVVPVTSLVAIVALLNVFWSHPLTGDSAPPLMAEASDEPVSPPPEPREKKLPRHAEDSPAGKAHASVSASGSRSGLTKVIDEAGPAATGMPQQDLAAAKSPRLRSRVPQPGERTLPQADESPLPQPDERVLPRPADIAVDKAHGNATAVPNQAEEEPAVPSRTLSAPAAHSEEALAMAVKSLATLPSTAGKSDSAASRAEGVAAGPSVLVVTPAPADEHEFLTLADACQRANSGDVIELRYDGRREEQPVRLANLRVTIRSGEGFHPAVVFRPSESDPLKCPRSMFTLTAGRLTLSGVALELQVPRDVPAENWSLMETRGDQTLRLEKCTLTVSNASDQLGAYHPDVAFFRIKTMPGGEAVLGSVMPAAPRTAIVELVDCIARGEAVLVRAEEGQGARFAWDNGLLVTSERLLTATGGVDQSSWGGSLQCDLRHVTAVVRGGLCRLSGSAEAPHPPNTQIYCADTILRVAGQRAGGAA